MAPQGAESTPSAVARLLPAAAHTLYAVYVGMLFLALALTTLLSLLVVPGVYRRRAVARTISRMFLWGAGMPVTVEAPDRLPEGQCVVVSNHASYIDGVVFTAALPPRFGFVIKREMASVPLAGLLLRRLGSEFVERFNRHRGASDARRLLRKAINGTSLVFFPEGTFTRTPGLLKFHAGAFVTAARAGCPVVPATVRGTRRVLSPTGGLPRPGRIVIRLLPAIVAAPDTPELTSRSLRDRAREVILQELGEPDLSASEPTDQAA